MSQIKSSVMPLTGLSCTNCAGAVETNLRKIPGVKEANVDFAAESDGAIFYFSLPDAKLESTKRSLDKMDSI